MAKLTQQAAILSMRQTHRLRAVAQLSITPVTSSYTMHKTTKDNTACKCFLLCFVRLPNIQCRCSTFRDTSEVFHCTVMGGLREFIIAKCVTMNPPFSQMFFGGLLTVHPCQSRQNHRDYIAISGPKKHTKATSVQHFSLSNADHWHCSPHRVGHVEKCGTFQKQSCNEICIGHV